MPIWEKQSYETHTEFKYFIIHRDLGITRTLKKSSEIAGKSVKLFEKASAKNKWTERCHAYDVYLDKIKLKENEQAIIDMSKRHIQISLMIQKVLIEKIKTLQPRDVTVKELSRLLDVSVRMERDARGLSCNDGQDLAVVTDNDRSLIGRIFAEALKNKIEPKNMKPIRSEAE